MTNAQLEAAAASKSEIKVNQNQRKVKYADRLTSLFARSELPDATLLDSSVAHNIPQSKSVEPDDLQKQKMMDFF